MPHPAQAMLADMAYQLGVHGVLAFDDMLTCMQREDWQCAHDAALDSAWARETPARAKRVSGILLTLK